MAGLRPFKAQGSCPMRGHILAVPRSLDARHREEGPCWHNGKRQAPGMEVALLREAWVKGGQWPQPWPQWVLVRVVMVILTVGAWSRPRKGVSEERQFSSSILNLFLSLTGSIP